MSLTSYATNYPAFVIYDQTTTIIGSSESTISLEQNKWNFITVTYNGSQLSLFINGTLVNSAQVNSNDIPKVQRTSNFFGKSNWPNDGVSSSYLDEIRFYNVSLTQTQIIDLMNENGQINSFSACPFITTTSSSSTTTTSTTDSTTADSTIVSTTDSTTDWTKDSTTTDSTADSTTTDSTTADSTTTDLTTTVLTTDSTSLLTSALTTISTQVLTIDSNTESTQINLSTSSFTLASTASFLNGKLIIFFTNRITCLTYLSVNVIYLQNDLSSFIHL
jgi:hypothetical protein